MLRKYAKEHIQALQQVESARRLNLCKKCHAKSGNRFYPVTPIPQIFETGQEELLAPEQVYSRVNIFVNISVGFLNFLLWLD